MSSSKPCTCPGTRKQKMSNWVVLDYKCNYSAFSGYHYTPSDYSCIRCIAPRCSGLWRTKADYVDDLSLGVFVNGVYEVKK